MATNREWLLLVWILKKGDYSYLLAYSDKLFICVMTLRKWMGVELFASLARRMMAEECKLESNQCRLLLYFLSRPLDELYLPLNLKKMSLQNLSKFFIDFCTFWFVQIWVLCETIRTIRETNPDLITEFHQVNVKFI